MTSMFLLACARGLQTCSTLSHDRLTLGNVPMPLTFSHELPAQRVIFARGALTRVGEEAARLGIARALVVATPGSGARLGTRVAGLLGPRSAGLHAEAGVHLPRGGAG